MGKINLLPLPIQLARRKRQVKQGMFVAQLLLLLGMGALWFATQSREERLHQQLISAQYARLTMEDYHGNALALAAAVEDLLYLERRLQAFYLAHPAGLFTGQYLLSIVHAMPAGLALQGVHYQQQDPPRLVVRGTSPDIDRVYQFQDNLRYQLAGADDNALFVELSHMAFTNDIEGGGFVYALHIWRE